jgi:hypothetical protein
VFVPAAPGEYFGVRIIGPINAAIAGTEAVSVFVNPPPPPALYINPICVMQIFKEIGSGTPEEI